MHSKEVVHRDLKPGNILFNKNDDGKLIWKISDFGASV
jgi:serine/threonine protein kinase